MELDTEGNLRREGIVTNSKFAKRSEMNFKWNKSNSPKMGNTVCCERDIDLVGPESGFYRKSTSYIGGLTIEIPSSSWGIC